MIKWSRPLLRLKKGKAALTQSTARTTVAVGSPKAPVGVRCGPEERQGRETRVAYGGVDLWHQALLVRAKDASGIQEAKCSIFATSRACRRVAPGRVLLWEMAVSRRTHPLQRKNDGNVSAPTLPACSAARQKPSAARPSPHARLLVA